MKVDIATKEGRARLRDDLLLAAAGAEHLSTKNTVILNLLNRIDELEVSPGRQPPPAILRRLEAQGFESGTMNPWVWAVDRIDELEARVRSLEHDLQGAMLQNDGLRRALNPGKPAGYSNTGDTDG